MLPSDILDNILSHLSANAVLHRVSRTSRLMYERLVPAHLAETDCLTLTLPKVELIKKPNKSIDDLLTWNREVKYVLSLAARIVSLDLTCNDFKIFNPLNEKLISRDSFP